jgi:hypothetical protein
MVQDPERLAWAAMTALQVPLDYARQGRNLSWAALAGAKKMQVLRHHPLHDVVDEEHQTRFYYHAHPLPGDEHEHGHFHVFRDTVPGRFHHLAALSLDVQGRPRRWFCTNQWVTGETWAPACDVQRWISSFEVSARGKMAPVARWLTALFYLDAPRLMGLILERDRYLDAWGPHRTQTWQNRQLHVLCSLNIDLPERIQSLTLEEGEPI